MKIVISADGKTVESSVDQRFGRCKYFLVVEVHNGETTLVEAIENSGASHGHGAGVKAAQLVADLKPDKVMTGNLGPNAESILKELEIPVLRASGPVKEAIIDMLGSGLEHISSATKNAHPMKHERIFIPLMEDKGLDSEISPHFGHAPYFAMYDTHTEELRIVQNELEHNNDTISPIQQIKEKFSPTIIFAQKIGRRAIKLLEEENIRLRTGDFRTVKEMVANLNDLSELSEDCGH
ncbi:MAG: hypothetical protein KJ709_03800 [Nanoarchaeota archaeon]|nr:hypothetical protein [Nanoarchaeota archaeon]